MSTLRCPTCGKIFEREKSSVVPFCCERCQLIDLGRWLGEEHGMPVERDPDDAEEAY